MKVLIVEPRKHPREAEIDGNLESMQKTVGGYLQAIYPFEDEIALVCDDESKLKSDTEWNRMLPETGDIIKGTFKTRFVTHSGTPSGTIPFVSSFTIIAIPVKPPGTIPSGSRKN